MTILQQKEAIDLPDGLIIKGVGGLYTVLDNNNKYYYCKPRGLFRKDNIKPVPGDYVRFEITDVKDSEGYLLEIYQRKNYLIRPNVANIDQALLMIAGKDPLPDLLLLDKLICLCEENDIIPVICINKTDLSSREDIKKIVDQYTPTGYHIILTSIKNKEHLNELEKLLENKKTVLAGQSGVGKSSILNHLLKEEKMETGGLSLKVSRGKHTTRHAQFIEVNKGYLVDTPGFSNFDASLLDSTNVREYYREFNQYEGTCRFNGCIHINEPGCKVKEAIKNGTIDIDRHQRYIELFNMVKKSEKEKRGY